MMSDGSLSQDEIDALLFQGGSDSGSGKSSPGINISDSDKDNLVSLLDGAKESMGETLSGILGKTTSVKIGNGRITNKDGLTKTLSEDCIEIKLDYSGEVSGEHLYVANKAQGIVIAGLMSGQDGVELDAMALASIGEAVSQITGTLATNIERKTKKSITPTAPEAQGIPKAMIRFPDGDFVAIDLKISIEGESEITFTEIFDGNIASVLKTVPASDSFGGSSQGASMNSFPMGGGPQSQGSPMGYNQGGQQMGYNQGGQQMGYNQGGQQMGYNQGGQQMGYPQYPGQMGYQQNVQGVQYPNLNQVDLSGFDSRNIGLLMDVSMELTVELGRTKWQIKDILGIGEGTIIELDKLAGEPVDILVNKNLIARGEVVVIDENFGVRVTEIVAAGAKGIEK